MLFWNDVGDCSERWKDTFVGDILIPSVIMLSKKKSVETQYMGTSGKYVKKETAKPRSKYDIC